MALRHTIHFLLNHPLNKTQRVQAVWRFLKWQIWSRITSKPSIGKFGEKSKIILKRGLTGATGNYYSGLHEFEDMSFLLHFLRASDLFVDIGANVGSYTVLAGNECKTQTITIEPIPKTFDILKQNVELNNISHLTQCLNIGLGGEKGILKFTKSLDTKNHVAKAYDTDTIDVRVERFDDIVVIDRPTLIKMDVEGYETEVLNGMETALSNNHLKAIIIELITAGGRYDYDELLIHKKLLSLGYASYSYNPHKRSLHQLETFGILNTIYIKDIDFVSNRLKSAEPFNVREQLI